MARKVKHRAKKAITHPAKPMEPASLNWAGGIKKALQFSITPKRMLPFFILDLVTAFVFISIFTSSAVSLAMFYPQLSTIEVTYMYILAFAVLIAWFLLNILITGALIYQGSRPAEFRKSWSVSCRRYPRLLAAMIVVGLASTAVSLVPFIGTLFVMVVAMIFLFVNQFVILTDHGFSDSLSGSVKLFRYKFLGVFITWLLNVMISGLIIIIFSLPLILTVFSYIIPYITQYGVDEGLPIGLMFMLFYVDKTLLYAEGALLLLGLSISKTFSLKFLTEIYLKMQKK